MRLFRHLLACCHALGLLWLLGPGILQAGVLAVTDTSAARAIDTVSYWSVLEAPTPGLDIAAVSSPALASSFRRADVRHDALSLGLHDKPVWLKLQISNDNNRDLERYLDIGFPHIDALELYEPQEDGFR